ARWRRRERSPKKRSMRRSVRPSIRQLGYNHRCKAGGCGKRPGMSFDLRKLAVATTGFCAFINLYSPQALLPELAQEFGVGPAEISATMTPGTTAIALTAPFTGALADVLGRRRVIIAAMLAVVIPMALIAFASDVPSMIMWRFLQGLLLPPIFAVT